MYQKTFQDTIEQLQPVISQIRETAHELHKHVNQTYDGVHPYGFHLDMVANQVQRYGHFVCVSEHDILPLFFGAYFHDSIEDARQTYNEVTATARRFMDEEQAHTAAEIVYALTNDKGRTRAERADDRYYEGIRQTPYAPFVKLADRLANVTYTVEHSNGANAHLEEVYRAEMPHFIESIHVRHIDDQRLGLPQQMVEELQSLL